MSAAYVATVALHVLAAVVWLGGMLFFADALRSLAARLARANALLGVALVYAAVRLGR